MNNLNNDKSLEALRRASEMAGPEPVTPDGVEVIPVCQPTLEGNERKYVMECMDTNWIDHTHLSRSQSIRESPPDHPEDLHP